MPDLTDCCGQLLVAGLHACADLAEQARGRRDDDASALASCPAARRKRGSSELNLCALRLTGGWAEPYCKLAGKAMITCVRGGT